MESIILAVGLDGTVDGTLCIPLGCIGTLVVELFALAQAQFHLDPSMLEIQRKRHQSVALQLALLVQPPDLFFMCQQTPDPQGVLIEDVAVVIGG